MAFTFTQNPDPTEVRLGATDGPSGLEIGALVATGTLASVPVIMVTGSIQATVALSGLTAAGCAYAASRQKDGKDIWPFDSKKESKKDTKKTESSPATT